VSAPIHVRQDETRLREDICRTALSIFERGLTAGSSGNISVRLDNGWLITPTDASLGHLVPGQLSKFDEQGRHLSGDPPSKEAVLHRAMYAERPSARAIVHLHSTYSAAVSCMDGLDCADCIPPLTAYYVMKIARLPLLPYFRPGDPRLADAVRGHACRHCAVLLANHGPVVAGVSLDGAVAAIEELEETAKLFLLLRGVPTRVLSTEAIAELEDRFGVAGTGQKP
jgi:ribulose-5-phosphate 4-epimerase/fuculose-1-phosphate aldolase